MGIQVRPSRPRGHPHCDSCFSQYCKAPVEISVSCVLIPCRLLCGAIFHLCKEEEHALLCPNERVPCLNAGFGCPISMPRSWLAAHLQVCPASVVCCSMEWNRWPAEDAQSHTHSALQHNLVKEEEEGGGHGEALDLAMALRDQHHLFHSLKMKNLFPELIERKRQMYYYSQLEPMKINTVRTFKIPTSFTAKHTRIRNPGHRKRVDAAVDTSDLGVEPQDMPIWEEVQASLLCSLEKEQRGHLIAESQSSDALLSDTGTQTYAFLSAPFSRDTSLASLTEDRPLQLHLQLQAKGVTARHNKSSSAFTFLCGHTFQRREFPKHFRNVHTDIQMCASGWFEQRCPLAYLGCTYSQRRFQPSTHTATVTYNKELSSFSLRPTVPASLNEEPQYSKSQPAPEPVSNLRRRRSRGGGGRDQDSLSTLPYEVLHHMASFLDSLSLFQLALVSHLMREVCSSLLHDRGMVSLLWEKKTYKTGMAKWKAKKVVWQFSTLFSPVEAWCFDNNVPSMSDHLKVCPYYEMEPRTERVLLPHIVNNKMNTDTQSNSNSLVTLFQKKT
ncbi:F-box only protein 40-like [Salvelinus namaycush]|uniref:F-box only protein 40-like n=1 Tax=Salvelinus namaycush TaxID=8040 RepID=A0A8U1FCA8_SALNM|nr:F-box only protein 40-like [Salvelinus namaycush]